MVDCSKMSRSDEPRGEPSLLGLSRGEDASRRKPMSEWHKKLCTATRERLSLDCSAKLVINIVAVNYSSHYFNFEEVKVDFEEVEVDFEEVGRISRKSDGFRGSLKYARHLRAKHSISLTYARTLFNTSSRFGCLCSLGIISSLPSRAAAIISSIFSIRNDSVTCWQSDKLLFFILPDWYWHRQSSLHS